LLIRVAFVITKIKLRRRRLCVAFCDDGKEF
jgi:hypothetical protein